MAGYTHGIMTLRVPQEVAQPIHRNARELNVDPNLIIMRVLRALGEDIEFAEIWAEGDDDA